MTVTVKLDALLEEQLRQRASAQGATTSEVIRQALIAYLREPGESMPASAHALGAGLFGRYRGTPGLASERKVMLADEWTAKHGAPR